MQFSKNFPLPKNGGHFEFLPKMAKHKFASISLTVRDRAISSKFSTRRVSKECNLCNFQKNFPSSMGNTGLLRREAEMTLLQPHLGETRCQELRNVFFWPPSLFKSQTSFLKKAPQKILRVSDPTRISPFVVPTRKEAPTGNAPTGAISSQSSNQLFSSNRGKQNFRGSRGRFRPHNRGRGRGNPSSQ